MTRRRIIAGGILLAAVAVAVPFAPGVWRKVAYEEVEILSMGFVDSEGRGFVTTRQIQRILPSLRAEEYVRVMAKRYSWAPGSEFVVLDQMCPACRFGKHDDCFPAVGLGANCGLPNNIVVELPPDFRCTCTAPSHDRD